MIEYRLRGADEAPSGRAPDLRHANVENLTIVLHIGVVSVNSVLTGEIVNDILPDQRGVVGKFQAPGLVLKERKKKSIVSDSLAPRKKKRRKEREKGITNLELGDRPPRLGLLRKSPNDGEEEGEGQD